jgi:hypothetical protein
MKRQKGQPHPRLEGITEPLRGILSAPIKYLKPSNIRLLRAAWCALECAVVQGCLSRLMKRYIGLFSTCIDALSWPFNLGVGAISQGG